MYVAVLGWQILNGLVLLSRYCTRLHLWHKYKTFSYPFCQTIIPRDNQTLLRNSMLPLALTLASLAISVSGSNANSSCPEVIVETSTIDEASTVYGELQYSTLSETLTFETTLANYTRTTTLTRTPDAHTITKTTGTSTALDPTSTTYTYECTSNSTM